MAEAGAVNPAAVTIAGQDGLAHAGPGEVIGKDGIHKVADVFIDISAVNPFLIKGSGGGNGKIISLVPVPFRINAVEGKGHNSQYVRINGGFRPGGIDF